MEKAKEYTSEEQQWLTGNRLSRFQNRITPSWIRDLGENEIFVFGSNVNGYHGGGAARFAMNNFGAVWGNGEGLQGSSYAIPTMEGLDNMQDAVKRFYLFARAHENYMFYVTPIACGIAGYKPEEIALCSSELHIWKMFFSLCLFGKFSQIKCYNYDYKRFSNDRSYRRKSCRCRTNKKRVGGDECKCCRQKLQGY